jgi:membrane fusion protein, multidrug efflux system
MDDLTRTAEIDTGQRSSLRRRSSCARWAVLVVVFVAAIVGFGDWWLTRGEVSTDDAYTDGRAITIAPQIAGTVVALDVADNQRVAAGQVLVEIDDRAYRAARDQAAANLRVAQAELSDAKLKLESARIDYPAQLDAARAQLAGAEAARVRAEADYRRQMQMPRQATTQQEVDAANATKLAADARTARARAALRQASTVVQSIGEAEASVTRLEAQAVLAQAQLDQAALNLAWTKVTAPQSGWITKRNVEAGSYVQPGQSLFAIVTPDVWVTANFRETDLAHMRPGQRVDIGIDAFPQLSLKGHVDSIQLGSGSRFTAFPPENATGNYVKIVQRVPVKIDIDSGLNPDLPLPLGVSVVPTVHLK